MNLFRLIFVFLMALPLSACSLSSELIEGRVLEEGVDKPIPDAIVVVRWIGRTTSGSMFVEARDVCYHVEMAATDEKGRYQTKGWSQEQHKDYTLKFDHMRVDAYKRGYGLSQAIPRNDENVYLAPFKGTREERLKYLMNLSGLASCYGAKDEKALFPIQKALYLEARGLAVTSRDQDGVQWIKHNAVLVWKKSEVVLTDSEIEALIRSDSFLSEQLK